MYKKKSLGQHFLRSAHYLKMVADAAEIKNGEIVLEVGPGDGALTAELLSHGAKVTAIEKDRRLIPVLQERFAKEIAEKNLIIIKCDALYYDISKCLFGSKKYKVVANIPYYITGALLKKFLSGKHQPSTLVFLVQKEVAKRIVSGGALREKESILSLSVKVYGTPRYIKTVPAGAFTPPPSVDSAILAVYDISRKNLLDKKQEEYFFELVRAGFAQKRKLLKKNLEKILGKNTAKTFQLAGITENARAEDVRLKQWLVISGAGELKSGIIRK